uniref:protein-tyrosine-phosphatase n=1 Tax=Haemonchus placei TaxID=6290 RepID=A0A0N4X881_HAEPC
LAEQVSWRIKPKNLYLPLQGPWEDNKPPRVYLLPHDFFTLENLFGRPLGRQQTAPSLPLATRLLYVGELVWQIDDTVFVGSQDAVANMNLLCRLNIEFVCDLCNEDGEEANRRRYDCPCLCPRRSQHFRYFVAMDVPETEKKCIDSKINMTVLFDQFCDLVERGRKAGKSVLVCSAKGRNRAPAFCAAYLISKERMTRQQAVAKVLEQVKITFHHCYFSTDLRFTLGKNHYFIAITQPSRSCAQSIDGMESDNLFSMGAGEGPEEKRA